MLIKLRLFILRGLQKRYRRLSDDCFEKAKYYCTKNKFGKAKRCVTRGRKYVTRLANVTSKLLKIAL